MRVYLFASLLLCYIFLCGCETTNTSSTDQKLNLPTKNFAESQQAVTNEDHKVTSLPARQSIYDEAAYIEEEAAEQINTAIEDAAVKLHSWLKRGRIVALQRTANVQLLLKKQPNGQIEMILSEMENTGNSQPTVVVQEIERGILSDTITIPESRREFWYDPGGSVHWAEPDYTFRPLDLQPQADVVLVPIQDGVSQHKGMLDIVPEKTLVYIHIVGE